MTRAQLVRTIADRTGESLRTVDRLGFQLGTRDRLEPEDIRLVVACPFCGRAVPYPGRTHDGSTALAECVRPTCDVYFDFDVAEVYTARYRG